jgi:hypothetical protein
MAVKLFLAPACFVLGVSLGAFELFSAVEPTTLAELRQEKVSVAKEWIAALGNSRSQVSHSEYYRAAQALKQARFEVATNKKERIGALQDYLDQVKRLYDKIESLHEEGVVGGEAHWWMQAKFRLLEARLWLLEEETKQ